jgi:hypothetical protein
LAFDRTVVKEMKKMNPRKPPVGTLNGSFEQLHKAACLQAELREQELFFYALMSATGNNVCDGCPVWEERGSACRAFQAYHSGYVDPELERASRIDHATTPNNVPFNHRFAGLSVKQIATQLGISIGEVRRRKAAGTL